jgi:hypothetical protein
MGISIILVYTPTVVDLQFLPVFRKSRCKQSEHVEEMVVDNLIEVGPTVVVW